MDSNSLDMSALKTSRDCWELVAEIGFVAVIVGVAVESAALARDWWERCKKKRAPKSFRRLILPVETLGFVILVAGLAVEFLGSRTATRRAASINAILESMSAGAIKEAGLANAQASTNKLDALQLEKQLTETKTQLKNAEARLVKIKNAIPPRQIPEKQRQLFIYTLMQSNNVSKTDIKVFVQDIDDPEANHFANSIRKMLNDSGYGTNGESVVRIPPFKVSPDENTPDFRLPMIFAIFATDEGGNGIQMSMTNFGSIMPMYAAKAAIEAEIGNPKIPVAMRNTANPNDILYGVSSLLTYIGVPSAKLRGRVPLHPGEVAFYIPPQVE